jgi:hypothetical protein
VKSKAPKTKPCREAGGSFASLLHLNGIPHTQSEKKKFYDSACAAAGSIRNDESLLEPIRSG